MYVCTNQHGRASEHPIHACPKPPSGELGFIRYTMLVTAGGQSWSIIRRFNDFQPLHEALSRAFPASAFRAQLPPKKWFGR